MLVVSFVTMYSCTDFQDAELSVGFEVDTERFNFPPASSFGPVTVSSGSKWDVTSMPIWISLVSVNSSAVQPNCWDVVFSADTNDEYDREGEIVFETDSESYTLIVFQEGKKGAFIPVQGISLDKTQLSLRVYDGYHLTPSFTPTNASDKTLIWRTNNPSVATVDADGYVQGLDSGEAVITVETVDGGKTATCTVTVTGSASPNGYKLVWHDEFNVDGKPSSDWWYTTGESGLDERIQYYVPGSKDGVDLAYISNGTLKIKSQKIGNTVYSVKMSTLQSWTYGWFEVRAKMTDVQGSWPIVWMAPVSNAYWANYSEMDLLSYAIGGDGKDEVFSGIFTWSFGKGHLTNVNDAASTFHVFACEWTTYEIRFYIDGFLRYTYANDGKNDFKTWPFYIPYDIKLDLIIGGLGGTLDESQLPAVYEIDYVRVYQ